MDQIISEKGKTVTFYSYKGGVGRSMALINIACLLAKKGKKVLMIDWDLEAPGLHTYFNGDVKTNDLGLVDLILDSEKFLNIEKNNTVESLNLYFKENLKKYIKKELILKEQKKLKKHEFKLDLLKAGCFDKDYTTKLSSINWMGFYAKTPEYFRTFAQHLEEDYDYILIDSRTGLADTSGVCTMLMPSVLVLVFALNQQNIDGVLKVCKQAIEYRYASHDERNLNIFPLPARIDGGNTKNYQHWEDIYKKAFENLFKDIFKLEECSLRNYFDIAHIKYDSSNSYGENIPILTENLNNTQFISYDYKQFSNILDREIPVWEYLSEIEIHITSNKAEEFVKQEKYKEAVELFENLLPYRNYDLYLNSNIAVNLIEYSKEVKESLQQEFLYKKAYRFALQQYELSGEGYNLACVCSLLNNKNEAIIYLEKSLKLNENVKNYDFNKIIKKDLDYDFVNIKDEPEFKTLMEKYNIDLSQTA